MNKGKVSYHLDKDGRFIVSGYNFAKPFSGFFPGIAGLYGRPMWAFYVNRAQCICSFGVRNKDGAIVEFQSANKAYTLTATHGFRTFLKVVKAGRLYLYEPFREDSPYRRTHRMAISPSDLVIWDRNHTLMLDTEIRYFCIPGEPFAALAREVKIKNESGTKLDIELLDGLPFILPYGPTERQTKDMSHTIQAWMEVVNLARRVPFYKLKVVIADRPVVTPLKAGNFYFGYYFSEGKMNLIQPLVDPALVFGPSMDLRWPGQFFGKEGGFIVPRKQVCCGITPSAMGYLKFSLDGGQEKTIYALIGHVRDIRLLNGLVKKAGDKHYFSKKIGESRRCIEELQENMYTESSSPEFNLYCKNTFLDNVLRGGFPVTLQDEKRPVVVHLFSRRHGDVERDYNKFLLQSTYFSQGDGNYRDVCQNRRNDIWFNPLVYEDNITTFVNLIQLDGYNPLVLKGDRFIIKDVPKRLARLPGTGTGSGNLADFLKKPFTLGEVLDFIEEKKIRVKPERLIKLIVSIARKDIEAEFKEGYWVDHWTYITDLLESYKGIYPERFWKLFTERRYTFFDSPAVVVARKNRFVLRDGKVRQYGSVLWDPGKEILIAHRRGEPDKVRTQFGKGKIYKTTLLAKLLCIIANKAASLDPFGTGVEMEADKPGWCDALNGLPGLFGSSACEVFELKRLLLLVIDAIGRLDKPSVVLPVELAGLLGNLNLKEEYREETKFGLSGKEEAVPVKRLRKRLLKILKDINKAIERAYDPETGLYHTYFINEVVSRKPLRFRQHPLPLFLEAQVHALRLLPGIEKARALYRAVRKNGLFDRKLKMYKLNASLKNESLEIGRTKVFTPGWLENESIWLHMEYKYLLELLRNGLYKEFYNDFQKVIIPFQDPAVFGRNSLENCSFIVSSAHPDRSLHGVGFLPRLTGATAEFIHMWLWMCAGRQPFFLDAGGRLNLRFQPLLAEWLFTERNTFSFRFLGSILVTYHNPERRDTFYIKPAMIKFNGTEIKGDTIPAPYAEQVRSRKINQIDIYFK